MAHSLYSHIPENLKVSVADYLDRKSIPEPNSGCWIWLGYAPGGYGDAYVKSRPWQAHRLSWCVHRGDIPARVLVCHKCDNTYCINPDHLFLGTHRDNAEDMARKRRAARGARIATTKLNAQQAAEVFVDRRPLTHIARDYGIDHSQVRRIKLRLYWRWATNHLP